MCLTNNRHDRESIRLSNTIVGGFEVKHPETGGIEHVMLYSNDLQGSASKAPTAPAARRGVPSSRVAFGYEQGADSGKRPNFGYEVPIPIGNAMLLPIPAKAGSIRLLPLKDTPNLARDYQRAVQPPADDMLRSTRSFSAKGIDSAPQVFKGFDGGVYDVVQSPRASMISSVFDKLDPAKRPRVNEALYRDLDAKYGERFQFLLYCFEESHDMRTGAAAVAYLPHEEWAHLMFLPGLDGHNGQIETGDVSVDHTIVLGSYRMTGGRMVRFSDLRKSPETDVCFPSKVIGSNVRGQMPQGDFVFYLPHLAGANPEFIGKRALPPEWVKSGENTRPDFYFGVNGVEIK